MNIPLAIALFILSIIVSLIGYIWASLAKKTDALANKVDEIDSSLLAAQNFLKCEPVTMQQIKELFDARFNEFRLELYKSGVLKP